MLEEHLVKSGGNKNGLILAPTSGGKTLPAVIVMLHYMLVKGKDVIMTLPYVAVVEEKARELELLATMLHKFSVSRYAGKYGQFPPPKYRKTLRTLYVATPEKANLLWKCLCKDGIRKEEVGLVMDELHMLSEDLRGSVLEELVVSVLHWSMQSTRLLGLSATVGNPQAIQKFLGGGSNLKANIYYAESRPVPIKEHIVVADSAISIVRGADGRGEIDFPGKRRKLVEESHRLASKDLNLFDSAEDMGIAKLVFESMTKNHPVLIFCNTKEKCVNLCQTLTKAYRKTCSDLDLQTPDIIKEQRHYVIGHLKEESKGSKGEVDNVLLQGILKGIIYHTAALHERERRALEDAYVKGIISVICCTTTLAAGVNLPAMRVIIRSPWMVGTFLRCSTYLQMVGRAGRGVDMSQGQADAFIFIQANDVAKFERLLEDHIEDVTSKLSDTASYYRRGRNNPVKSPECDARQLTGISRIIMSFLDSGKPSLSLLEMIKIYQLTLLYQAGHKEDEATNDKKDASKQLVKTIRPFVHSLQLLIQDGFVEVLEFPDQHSFELAVETPLVEEGPPASIIDAFPEDEGVAMPHNNIEGIVTLLDRACSEGMLKSENFGIRLTDFSAAAAAGSISLDDAKTFVGEVAVFERSMRLCDPLAFLYLSTTVDMSMPLMRLTSAGMTHVDLTGHVTRMIADKYEEHPDRDVFDVIGLSETNVNLWVAGSKRIRNDTAFCQSLTRMWSALCLRDCCARPHEFDRICALYGFNRGSVLELTSNLASRLHNLKVFCRTLDKYWWYPPLAPRMAGELQDTKHGDTKPLLGLRHVTVERAKAMLAMNLKDIRDVAALDPPTILSDKIKFLPKWAAVEIVLDAKIHMIQEAMVLAADSIDRQNALKGNY